LSEYCKIDIMSHHFVLTRISPRMRPLIGNFCRPLVEWAGFYQRGRFHKEAKKVYAASNADRTQYRFHINQYDEFLDMLRNEGIPLNLIDITVKRMYEPVAVDYVIPDHWVPREDQPRVIQYMEDEGVSKVVTLATGKGKALAMDAKLRIPNGWKLMREAEVGDILLSSNGEETKITGVYPQGEKQLYEVTFSDGRSVECCDEHLWEVYLDKGGWQVLSLKEIMFRKERNPSYRVYIPLCGEIDKGKSLALPIAPYTLGVYLGDGSTRSDSVIISCPDAEVRTGVELDLCNTSVGKDITIAERNGVSWCLAKNAGVTNNPIRSSLEKLKLYGLKSEGKFIPDIYLRGSFEQRTRLLQGLMDTDGTATTHGSTIFNTSSPQLARDVQTLARSLGHWVKMRTPKIPTYTYKGEVKTGLPSWSISIRSKRPKELFTIQRKRDRVTEDNQYAKDLKLAIVSIKETREAEAQCISVDHPSKLFITDDYIVTHNTFCSMKAAETLGVLTCFQMGGKYIEKWTGDLMETLQLEKKEICVIRGSKALLNAINLSIAGEFDYKVILLSTTTMARFYKDYEQGKLRGYPMKPEDFWKVMGIGLRVVDEAHENQHQIFKMDLYAHLPKTIFLSATVETDSPFRNRMLQIQWPERMRFKPADFDRYIRVRALTYELWDVDKVRHINQQKMYSHTLFEESIMKRPLHLAHYLAMIDALVYDYYVKRREDGQKCLVFAATTDLCGRIADHLSKRNPTLEVSRYVAEDDYEVLMESDISVSTALSAGTGVDVPGLRFSLMTTNVSSSQANIQIVGRLRKLKDWPDVEPEFMYILARNLPKHMEYHEKKKKLLRPRVKSIGEMNSAFVIGRPVR
jgi:hypothetical protein